jgi:hypothetical protein
VSGNPWTPGPWTRNRYGELIGANGKPIVFGNFGAGLVSASENPEAVSNTTLAHAAPEMAEALAKAERHMVSVYRAMSPAGNVGDENAFADNDPIVRDIRALLSRIRGDAP